MEKVKISKRTLKAAETKNKIYETAAQLFTKYGFEKVSVDSIVEMAGVSKGTFYVHFDSKDALIAALIADYVNNLDLDYKSYLDSFPPGTKASDILMSLAGKIADTIVGIVGYDVMRIIYEVQLTKTVNMDSVLGYNRELYKMFSHVISQGIQQGEFRTDIPAEAITKHCILALRGLTYEWCLRYPEFILKDQVLIHYEMLLSGIKCN